MYTAPAYYPSYPPVPLNVLSYKEFLLIYLFRNKYYLITRLQEHSSLLPLFLKIPLLSFHSVHTLFHNTAYFLYDIQTMPSSLSLPPLKINQRRFYSILNSFLLDLLFLTFWHTLTLQTHSPLHFERKQTPFYHLFPHLVHCNIIVLMHNLHILFLSSHTILMQFRVILLFPIHDHIVYLYKTPHNFLKIDFLYFSLEI